jgi:succinyl-CoA synthetase beta subunit
MDIKGHTVEKILIEEASDIKEEYYLSFTLDRSEKKYLMMLSAKGGMDIEAVAEENPDDLTMIHIDPSKELDEAVLIEAITNSKLNLDYESDLVAIITRLFKLFISGDCDLVEVNPLAITSSGVMALDSKVSLDMNAKYRHEDFDQIEKDIPIPPSEKSAKEKGLNFIKLDGSVGIIGNGAGLVMSTLDVVAEYGGSAANFLDIGGGAKAETVSAALEVLETDDSVSSVFINIFGGITRCDLVAQGIVEATKGKDLKWPIVIRLDGTNATEGLKILRDNPNEKIIITETMNEAAELSVKGNR